MTVQKIWPLLTSEELETVIQGLSLFTTLFDTSEEWLSDWLKISELWNIDEDGKIIYPSQLQDVPYKEFVVVSLMVAYWYPEGRFPKSVQLQDGFPSDNSLPIIPEYLEDVLSVFSVTDEGSIHWEYQINGSKCDSAIRDIQFQALEHELPQRPQEAQKITSIQLSRKGLQSVPNWVFYCKNIEILNLSHNKITSLPEEIYLLSQLTELNIAANRKLTTISNSICQLQKLEILLMNSTSLKQLPACFGELINLKHLNMSSTKIEEFPESFMKLKTLQLLSMNNCSQFKVDTLPKELPSLKYFSASRMGWTCLPEVVYSWMPLEELILSHNKLTDQLRIVEMKNENLDLLGNPGHTNKLIT